jgi:hypothetical protein
MDHYDVIIIGAGGGTPAHKLAPFGEHRLERLGAESAAAVAGEDNAKPVEVLS